MILHACNVSTHNNVVYVCILTMYRSLQRTELIFFFFLVFEGSFLEAAQAVLFHTNAIHFHHGRDIEDPSFFIL